MGGPFACSLHHCFLLSLAISFIGRTFWMWGLVGLPIHMNDNLKNGKGHTLRAYTLIQNSLVIKMSTFQEIEKS